MNKEEFDLPGILLALSILVISAWLFFSLVDMSPPAPVHIEMPKNITEKIGESTGRTTRKFSRGFWKGIWE